MKRRITRQIYVGTVAIGGDAPIAVQSMTNTKTQDAKATLEQIHKLTDAGCDIIRCAVPDMDAALALKKLCKAVPYLSLPISISITGLPCRPLNPACTDSG